MWNDGNWQAQHDFAEAVFAYAVKVDVERYSRSPDIGRALAAAERMVADLPEAERHHGETPR